MIHLFEYIQFALSDVVISGIVDSFPKLRRYKSYVIIGYCMVCFLLALPMCAPVSNMKQKETKSIFYLLIGWNLFIRMSKFHILSNTNISDVDIDE